GMYGGVLADRYPKRQLLLFTQATSAVFAAALGLLDVTGAVQPWHIYALAFLLGAAAAVDTPTRQAFVVELVGPSDLPNAIGLNFQMTLALMAKQTFHRDAASYGTLSAALAFGSLIGALAAARRPRPRHRILYGAAFVFGVLELTDAFIPSFWVLVALLVPTG